MNPLSVLLKWKLDILGLIACLAVARVVLDYLYDSTFQPLDSMTMVVGGMLYAAGRTVLILARRAKGGRS